MNEIEYVTPLNQDWYFYIVRCCDGSLYSGIKNNLKSRQSKNDNRTGAKYTSARKPVTLAYYEKCPDISKARKREIQVKAWSRSKKKLLIAGFPRLRSEETNPTPSATK